MYETISAYIDRIQSLVWGVPLIVLLLFTGVLLTVRLRLIQILFLPKALRMIFQNEEGSEGEISSSKSLWTALAATVGTGNIVGVATALASGGPGALFWMWIAAFFGMATKYAEAVLAVKYRKVKGDGTILGGPFYYIEQGLGKRWKFLAVLFAIFCAFSALLGTGTFPQIQSITSAVQNFSDPMRFHLLHLAGIEVTYAEAIAGACLTLVAGGIILGGLKRIASVAQVLVPLMIVIYLTMTLTILILHIKSLPGTILLVIQCAFCPKAVTGGVIGSIFIAMQYGIARGIFSNESGLGTAPIVAAAAQTSNPVRQGLVSMTGTFIDTIMICSMTGLTILTLSNWNGGLNGIALTSNAMMVGLPFLPDRWVSGILMTCMTFFAFTTTLGWNYYGERAIEYLVGSRKKWLLVYRWLFILMIFIAPYLTLKLVWAISDVMNGLMAFPNLIALIILSGVVVRETRRYLPLYKKGSKKREEEAKE